MKIDFDIEKDKINCIARGVSLAEAADLDWETAIFWFDTRRDYGEDRCVALGYISARLYCVGYTDRADARRIISLRKANSREEKAPCPNSNLAALARRLQKTCRSASRSKRIPIL